MATTRPWQDGTDDAALLAGHAAGKSLHGIAAELGVAKTTAKRKADAAGLSWDRSGTVAATTAKVLDAKARRAALQLRAIARAEALYDRLEAREFTTILKAIGGEERTGALTFVPPRDERDLAVTIRTHLDAAMRLDAHDSGTGATAVIGLLQQTAQALGIRDAGADDIPTP